MSEHNTLVERLVALVHPEHSSQAVTMQERVKAIYNELAAKAETGLADLLDAANRRIAALEADLRAAAGATTSPAPDGVFVEGVGLVENAPEPTPADPSAQPAA